MDSQDWSIFDEFSLGDWVCVDYPEYRIFGKVERLRIDRHGRTCLRLVPAYEVGLDKYSEEDPFRSPAMDDCRPSRAFWISDDCLRKACLCKERWEEWPGKDE